MTREHEYPDSRVNGSEELNPVFIARLASRLFNELPEAGSLPKFETDAEQAPSGLAGSVREKAAIAEGTKRSPDYEQPDLSGLPLLQPHGRERKSVFPENPEELYFLGTREEKEPEPLEHHANKLTEQQNYSENGNGSHGIDEALQRDISSSPQNPEAEGTCYAEKLYRNFSGEDQSPGLDRIFQSLRHYAELASGDLSGKPPVHGYQASAGPAVPGADIYPGWTGEPDAKQKPLLNAFGLPSGLADSHYFLRGKEQPAVSETNVFDVAAIRRDFPVLHQKIHGRDLVWLDNAATTQKPWSVINAVSNFYALDNSNIHRGAHTLAARSTDAYEATREKVRQFIGASSASEIIFVRGTTEGINLVAQSWGRRFLQPGDEIVLSILEHHANIVPWQMVAKETGARIKVIPVNSRGEIILDEYTKLLGPRTRFVSLTQASNGLGTILPVKEMIRIARRFDVKVLIDGAQSVAHIPVNVQDLDADFFVFSGHKIFAPTGIGVVYGKREVLETMPPWQGGGNMIRDVRFEETLYNGVPAKFEAGTPSVADAVGLGAALDYVRKIGLEHISRYEHDLTKYATERLQEIPGLRIIGTAASKVGVLSFVLNNLPNEEVGKLLDREGIAVRAGHHCTQPSLRHFGVEGTVRPSLAFYNTREEIDRLADAVRNLRYR